MQPAVPPCAHTYRWNPYALAAEVPTAGTMVPAPPTAALPSSEVWAVITSLRSEKKDAIIDERVNQMSPMEVRAIYGALLERPDVVVELCVLERGNIVAQVMTRFGGDGASELFDVVMTKDIDIAKGQSGCIAMTRIYDAGSPAQRQALDAFCLAHFDTLVLHEFGNYVVQRVLEEQNEASTAAILARIGHARVLIPLSATKAGSHVIEKFVKVAPEDSALTLIAIIIKSADVLSHLAHDNVGNYVLQASLRRLATLASTSPAAFGLLEEAQHQVVALAANSRFLPNIKRSMMGQQTGRGNKFQAHGMSLMPQVPGPVYHAGVGAH